MDNDVPKNANALLHQGPLDYKPGCIKSMRIPYKKTPNFITHRKRRFARFEEQTLYKLIGIRSSNIICIFEVRVVKHIQAVHESEDLQFWFD